ncbi:MAG: transcription-repair coupling factor [Bdellovibrionaceae bacterium]|nr:transcription-repair coupling factor [Pseudobdellovibrionaceae bacterium]
MRSTRKLELSSLSFQEIPAQYFVEGFHKEAFIVKQLQEVSELQFVITSTEAELHSLYKNLCFLLPNRPIYTYIQEDENPWAILRFLKTLETASPETIFLLSIHHLRIAPSASSYKSNQTSITPNYSFPISVENFMLQKGYKPSLIVEGPGQFSIKAGVLDFFSPQNSTPTRCELFGDTVTALFSLDVDSQITMQSLLQETLWNKKSPIDNAETLLNYFPKNSCIWNFCPLNEINNELSSGHKNQNIIYLNQNSLHSQKLVEIPSSGKNLKTFTQKIKQKNILEKKVYLKEQIKKWNNKNIQIVLSSEKHSQSVEIKNLFLDINIPVSELESFSDISEEAVCIIQKPISCSFILEQEKLVLLKAQDLLSVKNIKSLRPQEQLKLQLGSISIDSLNPGDLVTHIQHGVGRYLGLKFMTISSQEMEFIHLEYKDKEQLYIPVYKINSIKKYIGNTSILDKLGNNKWQHTKTQVKKRLQDISFELLELYAQRKSLQRPAFTPSKELYKNVSAGFPYKETKDQAKAINSVLSDLLSTTPMDRLICGDVGFGKTEVAVRACARAIENNKQVAILVPTTVLAFQHHKHFFERLNPFSVQVETLNRFVPLKKQKEVIAQLKTGQVDVLIGTHKLLNNQLEYKKLGLLIIDEEQKFGVKHKEKIKHLKKNIDTLTLSATPIPRTLNFSLLGLKDINLIQTPPQNRLSIRTFINSYNKNIIKEAIQQEMQRGGQIFFLHNKVKNIELVSSEIKELVPTAKVAFAHGQLPENQLEQSMLDFANKKTDILVCTTIIESGLDIPNANTLIINNAHLFGLSQLYQIRGRVGRSNHRAYCYLLIPPQQNIDEKALERLHSIRDNTKLGSGIYIAQKDLELRGAGDLLGEEQSGTLNAIGYELYLELLEEAINQAKSNQTLKKQNKSISNITSDIEPDIYLPYPCLIPQNYISDIRTRLYYYKKISSIQSINDMDFLEDELRNNFCKPPVEVYNLMGLILIKNCAKTAGILSVSLKNTSLNLKITNNSPCAEQLIALIQKQPEKYQLSKSDLVKIEITNTQWEVVYQALQKLMSVD